VPEVLTASDLFVFPSYSEGFGMVALESLAAGCPVVAYDLPPFHEFLEPDRTALLVPVGDVTGLTGAVVSLLDDPSRRREMASAGAAEARRRFPADGVARAFQSVYEDVLGAPASRTTRRAS
jgi:glycosyltransferase involved in cell wall biosynthesis